MALFGRPLPGLRVYSDDCCHVAESVSLRRRGLIKGVLWLGMAGECLQVRGSQSRWRVAPSADSSVNDIVANTAGALPFWTEKGELWREGFSILGQFLIIFAQTSENGWSRMIFGPV